MRAALPILLLLLIAAPALRAVEPDEFGGVRFDFEERGRGNAEELPMFWEKVAGPGLPFYVNGRLATDAARSGRYAFRLDLNGGSLIYRYPAGRIPVSAGALYRVRGFARTTPLRYARARLSAYFTDAAGKPVGDPVRSDPLASADGDKSWHPMDLTLAADDPAAAFLVVEVALLQPDKLGVPAEGVAAFAQDIRGSAWFDDLSVLRAPRVALVTNRPANVFGHFDPPRLLASVGGAGGDELIGQWAVTDAAGHTVFQRTERLAAGPSALALPALHTGWYDARLNVSRAGEPVASARAALAVVAQDRPEVPTDGRFGVVAPDLSPAAWGALADAAGTLGAGRVRASVDVSEAVDGGALDRLLAKSRDGGRAVEVSILGAGATEDGIWRGALADLLSRHAADVGAWQVGTDADADAVAADPAARAGYERVRRAFATLAPGRPPASAWPVWRDPDPVVPGPILTVPASVLPRQIPLYVGPDRAGAEVSVSAPDAGELVKRVGFALAAGAGRVDVPLPFAATGDGSSLRPTPMLLPTRTLLSALRGATYAGDLALGKGIDALLFDSGATGTAIVWSDAGEATVDLDPSLIDPRGLMAVDLLGRPGPVPNGRLAVGPTPVFVVNLNLAAAKLRAGVRLERPVLESTFDAHARRLTFTNPTAGELAGSIALRPPAGWTASVAPAVLRVGPGETWEGTATLRPPYGTPAGEYVVEAVLAAPSVSAAPVVVPLTVRVGLGDVGLRTIAFRDAGNRLIVQQTVTNYGDKPFACTAYVASADRARQDALISTLPPGGSAVRSHYVLGGLSGEVIRSGLIELGGTRTLVEEVRAP